MVSSESTVLPCFMKYLYYIYYIYLALHNKILQRKDYEYNTQGWIIEFSFQAKLGSGMQPRNVFCKLITTIFLKQAHGHG